MKRRDSKRRKNKRSIGRRILIVLLALVLAGAAAVIALFAASASSVGHIDPRNIYDNIDKTSFLYDTGGRQIDALHYDEDRQLVSIDEMPEDLRNAFIAIEDKTFYSHHGFNFTRIIGAVLSSLTGEKRISGTSTITQQLARNAYLADIKSQRSIRRKVTEMYLAARIEHSLSKDEILEAYLNTIYLGYGSYGIKAAARTYFSKEVRDLDLAECAALAALPQAPDAYALISKDEGENTTKLKGYGIYANDASKDRRDLVLSLMREQGFITEKEEAAAKVDIKDILDPTFEEEDPMYTYFADFVSDEVTQDLREKYDLTEEEAARMLYTGGLKIHTTLNTDIQRIVYDEFSKDENFPAAIDGSEVQASMVITEVGSGRITAMAGGRNTKGSKLFNRATSPRQPGSSIKPLSVYGAALQKSYDYAAKGETFPFIEYEDIDRQGTDYWGDYITAGSVVIDEPLKFNGEIWPYNVTRSFSGANTLRSALRGSINTCAVKTQLQVGTDYSVDMLKKFGITTVEDDAAASVNDLNPAALALGAMTYGVTPLEMALAYAAFPNGGVRDSAVCYTDIEDMSGNTILTGKSEDTKVMDEGVAWIMADILESNVENGMAMAARIEGTSPGGKTGTTNDRYDVWFDGFTPKYSAALWIGTDKNKEMNQSSWIAAYLWGRIMGQIPDITEGEYRQMPSDVIEQRGEYYTKGTEPYRTYETENTYDSGSDNSYDSEDTNDDDGSYDEDSSYDTDDTYDADDSYDDGEQDYTEDDGEADVTDMQTEEE